jgi:hypothetical protein
MNQSILKPFLAMDPGREIKQTAAAFLGAVMNQYPQAMRDFEAGVKISVSTHKGVILEIGGAIDNGQKIIPGIPL